MIFLTADSNLRPLPLVFLIKKPTAPFKIEDFNRFDTIKIFDNEVAFAPTVSLKTYGFLTSFSPVWRGDHLKTSTECKIFDFKQQENLWLLLLF